MSRRLKVLSVGSERVAKLVKEMLAPCSGSSYSAVDSYWQLCLLSLKEAEQVSVAILEVPGSVQELRQKAKLIRRRWPEAEIVLIGDVVDGLEHPLYDERVLSGTEASDLLIVIERLLSRNNKQHR